MVSCLQDEKLLGGWKAIVNLRNLKARVCSTKHVEIRCILSIIKNDVNLQALRVVVSKNILRSQVFRGGIGLSETLGLEWSLYMLDPKTKFWTWPYISESRHVTYNAMALSPQEIKNIGCTDIA
jgi:hypothetical protein